MIVICEECGKKYRIDPGKIKGAEARFKCRSCSHLITVQRPAEAPAEPVSSPPPAPEAAAAPSVEKTSMAGTEEAADEAEKTGRKKKEKKKPATDAKRRGMGLRAKMFLLFLIIPILIIAAAGFLYLKQFNHLATLLTRESTRVVTRMAQRSIADTARTVARECRLYLQSHPDLPKEEFNRDPEFRKIAVHKVGRTGYTALYELPASDGIWHTWAHVNPKIIGIDMSRLKKPLGRNFPGFWRVYTGVRGGRESRGYYTWQDKDGSVRDKFMVCAPVKGTRYIVAATTYLDEFTLPIRDMAKRAEAETVATRNIVFAILGGSILLIGVIVSVYGHGLTRRIRVLTDTADRISVGELDAEIDIKSKDEIGDLAEAISRMQESIRLSIERLRRRK